MWFKRTRETAHDALAFAEELGATVLVEARQELQWRLRQLVIVAIASGAAMFGIALACVALLAWAWDTPYRMWMAIGLASVFFALATGLGGWLRANPLIDPWLPVSRREAVRGLRALKHRLR